MHCSQSLTQGLGAALAFLLAGPALATTVYDESVSGDLIDGQTASPWLSPGYNLGALSIGDTSVAGSFGLPAGGGAVDTDVLTWSIAPGMQLDAIQIDYTVLSGDNGNGSYLAIAAGATVGTGMATASGNLSDALVPSSGDLLTAWTTPYAFGSSLTAPLGAGAYTLWASETGALVGYTLTFQVTAVPEPQTWAMLLSGLGLSGWAARRRHARHARG